ncbi:YjcG family protein [Bacillus sp. 2205SS5-2]|uniref:YjcG family protein n=1 Tax=Bacillus sp. 2205SS5-2 TaxID=3109031 RepID=UPI003003DB9B
MNYGIVIFPSKKLQDQANSYRKRYDPHYALITPHITLKNGFDANEGQIQQLSQQLEKISNQHEPFSLKVSKISSFQPVNNVIYLKVEPTSELETLHKAMHGPDMLGELPEYSFVPHITIAQGLSNDEHSDVYGSLRMLDVNQEEMIDRFHLLYQLENGSWTVHETFRLGKDC